VATTTNSVQVSGVGYRVSGVGYRVSGVGYSADGESATEVDSLDGSCSLIYLFFTAVDFQPQPSQGSELGALVFLTPDPPPAEHLKP